MKLSRNATFNKRFALWGVLLLSWVAGVIIACGGSSSVATNPPAAGATGTVAGSGMGAASHKAGDTVKADATWTVTLNAVTTSQGGQYDPPAAGHDYLVVDATLKNTSAQSQTASSLLMFDLKDATGQKYTVTIAPSVATASPDGAVEAGGTLRGQVVYEVPSDQHQFTLLFTPEIAGTPVVFAVSR